MSRSTDSTAERVSRWQEWRAHKGATSAIALAGYTVMAIALFSNTWIHPKTWSIGFKTGDPHFFMWSLSWPMFAVTHGDNPLFTNYMYYPAGVNLMWNTSILLPALVLSPVTWLGGPVLAYNLLETVALALSAWAAFIFIRRFVSSQLAAAAGAALYGFSPCLTAQSLGHPQITAAFLPPIIFLILDDIVRVQRRPAAISGLLLGVAGAAQLLIGAELLATTAFVAMLLICLAVAMRTDLVRPKLKYALRGFAYAAVVFAVLAAGPIAFQLIGPQHLHGVLHPLNAYVSDAWSFIVPTRLLLLAPDPAVALSNKFAGGVVEVNSYVGVPLAALLAFIAVRYWRLLMIRLATLTALLIAILSMGITIHYAGATGTIPVFTLGLAFPLLQRFLPGRLMLYLTFLGGLALSQVPALNNILPTRLMLYFYLLAGLMLAVFLNEAMTSKSRLRALAPIAAVLALLPLVPVLPYPSSPDPVPAFFDGGSASRIPEGSVALVVPLSLNGDAHAVYWQAMTRMRFRMPEGYANVPPAVPKGSRLSEGSQVAIQVLAVASQEPSTLTDATRLQMLTELARWQVKTVIIGPMTNEQREVDLFASLFNRPPQQIDGVYVWWNVDSKLQ